MTLPVIWDVEAEEDLASIVGYIARDSLAAARRVYEHIHNGAMMLAAHPYMGHAGRLPGTRELVIRPSYIVVYEVHAEAIEVLGVVHASRKYP